MSDCAAARSILLARIFRIQPCLDRAATCLRTSFVASRPFLHEGIVAAGAAYHPLDEVDAGHFLGDGVLDLETRIHLEEEELLAPRIQQKFDCPRGAVRYSAGQSYGAFGEGGTQRIPELGGGSLFDDLLVAPLQRAVALAESDHLSCAVAEDLHLDVTRLGQKPLEIHAGIRKVARRKARHCGKRGLQGRHVRAGAHPDAAATAGRLEHQWKADTPRGLSCAIEIGEQ